MPSPPQGSPQGTEDDTHASEHEPGGNDEVQDVDINGTGTNLSSHASRHESGGSDAVTVGTGELDLSISPTWTGVHTFNSGFDIGDFNRESLSGNKTLASGDPMLQSLDPNGSNRDVNLPAEDDDVFVIGNRADASGEDLVLKDDGGTTLVTLNQDDVALCVTDGTGWMILPAAGTVT